MKKLKLLLLAFMAMCGLGASAQLTDGTVYWIQDASTGEFISQGANWGTQATVQDVGGLGFEVVYKSEGVYQLKNIMWNKVNNADLGLRVTDGYCDQPASDVTLTASGEGFLVGIAGGNYLCNNQTENTYGVKALGLSTNSSDATVWKFLTKTEYDAAIQAYKDKKAASFATSLGYTAASVSALEAILAENYITKDYTSSITNAALNSGNTDGWTATKPNQRDQAFGSEYGTCAEAWNGCVVATQTVGGLPTGLYKVTFVGTFRPKGNTDSEKLASEQTSSPAYVFANDAKEEFIHWIDVPAKANNRTGIKNNASAYTSSFYTYVTDGSLKLGVKQDAWYYGNMWCPFGYFTLTYYSDAVSDEDVTAILSDATALESQKMNADVLSALTSAKNTFDGARTIANYNALTTAITNANASVTAYANAKTYFDKMDAELANTNFYTVDAYATNYTTPKSKYEAGTLTNEEANALWGVNMPALFLSAWSFNDVPALTAGKPYMNTWSTENDGDIKTPFYEHWVGDNDQLGAATIQGEMTGLTPNQLYKVDITARLRMTNNKSFSENGVTMQVGEGTTVDFTTAAQLGTTPRYQSDFTVTGTADADGKLTVKIVVAENSGTNWLSFKNVKYAELDDERIPYAEQLATVVAEAKSLSTTLAISDALKTELFNTANKYQDYTYTSFETVAEFTAAITEVNDAIANANTFVTPYAAWKEMKAYADALVAVSTNNTKENAALASDIDTQNTAVEAATTVDAIGNATTTLKTAMVTYATTAEPTNEECFDITFMIENPHFTEGEGGWGKVASGWTLESGSITEHRLLTHNFEAYHTQFNLSQTISGLQKGTYKVTLQGFARHDNNGPTDKTNLYCGIVDQKIKDINDEYSENPLTSGKPAMGDNNGEAGANGVYRPNGMSGSYYYFQEINPKTNQPFYTNEVQTLITEAGDLKIGFKCETGTDWVIWDNFHLYYYGSAIAVELDEATGSSYTEDIDNANVTLKKTIFEGWNTITIPFAASAADFKGTELYKYTGDDETTLKFEPANSIEPNVPYLIKATEATNGAGTFTFKGITVKAATDLTTEGSNYNFLGTYQEATVADGDYILGEDAFYRSNGGNKVKAYRAYIQKKSGGENARLTIFIDGKATAIDTIDGEAIGNADIYNLAGQKVKNAQKGVYIQNGKKFVVK